MGKNTSPFLIIVILVLGLGLRLINIHQSFWLDEASQAQLASPSLSQIWSGRGGDFHPPLFYFLAHFWLQFGRSEPWLRLLPISFGLFNIYLVYKLAKILFANQSLKISNFKLKIEYLAALLLALSPFHIYYSQEFRMYSLLALLGTLAMYLLVSRRYLWLSIVNALLLYTHYSSIFLILAQTVYVILYARRDLKLFTIHYLLLTIYYIPWLPQFARQLGSGLNIDNYLPGWRQVLSISPVKAFPVIFFKLVAGRISFISKYLYGLYITFVFAVTFTALAVTRIKKHLLFIWVFVPIFSLLFTSLILPQNQPFRVIFVLPGLIILFASACFRYPKLFLTLILYIFLVGDIAYFTRPRLQREQWRQAIGFLSGQPGITLVKFSDKFAPFYWYSPDYRVIPAVSVYPARKAAVTDSLSAQSLPSQIFLLQYLTELTDPDLLVDSVIKELGYRQTRIYNFEGVGFIYQYKRI